jgi:hypothetical protein
MDNPDVNICSLLPWMTLREFLKVHSFTWGEFESQLRWADKPTEWIVGKVSNSRCAAWFSISSRIIISVWKQLMSSTQFIGNRCITGHQDTEETPVSHGSWNSVGSSILWVWRSQVFMFFRYSIFEKTITNTVFKTFSSWD